MWHSQTTRSGVERGEIVVAPSEYRDTGRLKMLEGARKIEEGLGPGAHRHQGMGGDGVEIGADIAGDRDLAVNAADAAGREDRDPSRCRQREGGRNGGRAELPTLGHRHREIALGCLTRGTENPIVLILGDTDPRHTVEDGSDRGDRPSGLDRRETAVEGLSVGR